LYFSLLLIPDIFVTAQTALNHCTIASYHCTFCEPLHSIVCPGVCSVLRSVSRDVKDIVYSHLQRLQRQLSLHWRQFHATVFMNNEYRSVASPSFVRILYRSRISHFAAAVNARTDRKRTIRYDALFLRPVYSDATQLNSTSS